MLSAAAQFLAGVHVALAVAWVVDTTQRVQLLVGRVAREALAALLPAPVDSEAAAVASTVVLVDEVAAVEALAASEVSAVEEEEEEEEGEAEAAAATVEDEEVSGINQTAMGPATVLRLVLVALEVEVVMEVTAAADGTTIDVGATTGDPAVLTTNRSAAGIDTATVTVDMVEAETMARGSARTMVTATTTHEHDEGTKLDLWLSPVVQWFVKKVTSLFFAPAFLVNEGKIDSVQLLTFRLYSTAQYRRVRSTQHQKVTPRHHCISRVTSIIPRTSTTENHHFHVCSF